MVSRKVEDCEVRSDRARCGRGWAAPGTVDRLDRERVGGAIVRPVTVVLVADPLLTWIGDCAWPPIDGVTA